MTNMFSFYCALETVFCLWLAVFLYVCFFISHMSNWWMWSLICLCFIYLLVFVMTGDRLQPRSTTQKACRSRKQFRLLQISNKGKGKQIRLGAGRKRSERLAVRSETGKQEYRVTECWKAMQNTLDNLAELFTSTFQNKVNRTLWGDAELMIILCGFITMTNPSHIAYTRFNLC